MFKDEKHYFPTEVGTLIESFSNQISAIAGQVSSVSEDSAEIKEDIKEIKTRLTTVEDACRIAIPDLYSQMGRIKA